MPVMPARALTTATLVTAVVVTSFGIVSNPWLMAGAVLGMVVVAIALTRPLLLVGLMLVIGPMDLSFLTGGFKSLFPELGGLDMNGIRLLAATAGFVTYALHVKSARRAALGPLGRWYLVFLAYAATTLAASFDPLGGLRLYLKLAYPALTFLIVVGLADSEEKLLTLMRWTLGAAAVIVLLVNPLFALDGGYRIDPQGFRRVRGLGAHENPFSFYLMIMLLISYARFLVRGQWRYLLLCAPLALWMVLTLTRITLAGTVAGVLVITILSAFAARKYSAVVAGSVVTALVAIPFLPPVLERSLGYLPSLSELIALIQNPAVLYTSINVQGRDLLWAVSWSAFITAPILGLGLGSSSAVIRESFPSDFTDVAHNEYLRIATDAGIVGVLLFAVAIMAWLAGAVRLSIQGNARVREFAFPATAGIVAWAIVSITDNPLDYYTQFTQYIGFLLAGAVLAQGWRSEASETVVTE